MFVPGKYDRNDEVTKSHTDGADGKDGLATDTIDVEDGRDGTDNVSTSSLTYLLLERWRGDLRDEHDDADDTSGKKRPI